MTSESLRIEQQYPAGHRDRHTPHLCARCGHPLTSAGTCTHCADRPVTGRAPMSAPTGRSRK